MAGIKISNLPTTTSALTTDEIPVTQGSTTYKETWAQAITLFSSYLLALTGGTMSGAINMGSHKISSLTDPTLTQDAATKGYVDTVAAGLNPIPGCQAASTTALTVTYANGVAGIGATLTNAGSQAAFAIDGYSASLNDRILIKNQASSFQNGIYTVTTLGSGSTNWVLTRATDYDTPLEIQPGDLVAIENGTVNIDSTWFETATVVTVGTSAITFSAFFTPATYLQVANNLSDVNSQSTSRTNLGLGTAAVKAASDGTKSSVASVSGATTTGNVAIFADTAGTVENSAIAFTTSGATALTLPTSGTVLTTTATGRLIAVQVFTSGTPTYTPTSGATHAIVKLVGAGGGGGGGGGSGGTGGTGGTTSLGVIATAVGGTGGSTGGGAGPGAGGGGTGGTFSITGGTGELNHATTGSGQGCESGAGGNGVFGGAGLSAQGGLSGVGPSGIVNTGGGGAGGSSDNSHNGACGGGAGGYTELYWTSISSQTITVGAAGTAGTAGTGGANGGAGGSGIAIIYEYT